MASQWVLVAWLAVLFSAGMSNDAMRCFDCFTNTPRTMCHVQPKLEPEANRVCRRGTKRCVTERHQAKDGAMISVRRRCATRLESRFSYNRCDEQSDGTSRCLSYCRDNLCNRGTGRLYTTTLYWNYDSPDYADYVYDPEQAVLDPKFVGDGDARHDRHVHDPPASAASGALRGACAAGVLLSAAARAALWQ